MQRTKFGMVSHPLTPLTRELQRPPPQTQSPQAPYHAVVCRHSSSKEAHVDAKKNYGGFGCVR